MLLDELFPVLARARERAIKLCSKRALWKRLLRMVGFSPKAWRDIASRQACGSVEVTLRHINGRTGWMLQLFVSSRKAHGA